MDERKRTFVLYSGRTETKATSLVLRIGMNSLTDVGAIQGLLLTENSIYTVLRSNAPQKKPESGGAFQLR
jgi:hypothetical protein